VVVREIEQVEAAKQRSHRHLVGPREERAREGVEHQLHALGQPLPPREGFEADAVQLVVGGVVLVASEHLQQPLLRGDDELLPVEDAQPHDVEQVEERRGLHVGEAHLVAIPEQDAVVLRALERAANPQAVEEPQEVVVAAEEGVEAVLDRRGGAILEGVLPRAELPAEVGVSLVQRDREPAPRQRRRGGDAR
jgi:hypothetical protein